MLKKTTIVACLLALFSCDTTKQPVQTTTTSDVQKQEVKQENTSKSIPNNPKVTKGTLSNGLTYYIQNNGKPTNKVELRLVVKAGSILEDDDQKGLAHFMEHMAFNGTKNFAKNDLVDYLQSIGVKFGAHLNAYTSFDETVYILPIPSDDPEKLEKGFQIIEDWAFNATLTDEAINNERGVVLEEYRTGLGAQKRMMQNYLPKLVYQSKYSERLPIGTKASLETFKTDAIRRFYKDWYRPDLIAVVAVGDVDVATLEAKIKSHFGKYTNPENPRKREQFSDKNHSETFIAIESDPEASNASVQLMYKSKTPAKPSLTTADAKKELIEGLFAQMINNRLGELRNSPKPPFVYGYSFNGSSLVKTRSAYQSIAMPVNNEPLVALKALVEENERVRRYGFYESELNRAKKMYIAQIEKAYQNKDKQESRQLVQAMISNFLENESMPSLEWTRNFFTNTISTIKLTDVNALISNFITEDNRVVLITGKEKTATKDEVLAILNNVKNDANIKPYKDEAVQENLMTSLPKKGGITSSTENTNLGVKTITLSNGAVVKYKKTDLKDDEILFSGTSFGGTSLVNTKDYLESSVALSGISEAGIAGMNKNDLKKVLTGKIANVRFSVGGITERISGSCAPKDLETLMQLTYLNFTAINKDENAFKSFVAKQKGFLSNMLSNPNVYFSIEMAKFTNEGNPRFIGFPTPELYDKANYDLAYDIYKQRFANAGDFTFYFVGNFDEAELKRYAEQYLASLPSTGKKEEFKDHGFRPLTGKHEKIVHKGTDPKSSVRISYSGETTYDAKKAMAFKALSEILSIKMVEKLREEAAGVYSPRVSGSISKTAYDAYRLSVSFGCGPENVDKLKAIVFDEIKNIIANGPTQKDLDKAKETFLLSHKESLEKNRTWLNWISSIDTYKYPESNFTNYDERVKSLTVEEIKNVAKEYLSKGPITGILLPENQ